MIPEEVIDQLVALLRAHPKVVRIVLFGSRARGDNQPRSDIDLAVSMPDGQAGDWRSVADTVDQVRTLLTIDLVRWDDAPVDLRTRIQSEGKVLYERSDNPVSS